MSTNPADIPYPSQSTTGHSSLFDTESAAAEPTGRDSTALGPGDSSDSGSDLSGAADVPEGDPGLPVDVAMRDDMAHSLRALDLLVGDASDAAGTGERRSAAGDAGQEAADIGFDRIITPGGDDELADDEDPDLGFIDRAQDSGPSEDDEEEDDNDDDEVRPPEGERDDPATRPVRRR